MLGATAKLVDSYIHVVAHSLATHALGAFVQTELGIGSHICLVSRLCKL